MSEPLAADDRHEQMLGEFAEWLHASAREAQRRLMAAESAEDFATYNNALHKLGRGLRQTLALHKRFQGERLRGEAETARKAREAGGAARTGKRSRISHAMERLVWTEYERDEEDEDGAAERLLEDIEDRLDDLAAEPDFMDTPDEALIEQLSEEFGFGAPPSVAEALTIVAAANAPRPAATPDTS